MEILHNWLNKRKLLAYRKPLEAANGTVILPSIKQYEFPFPQSIVNLQSKPISRRVFVQGSIITILMLAVGPYLFRFLKKGYMESGVAVKPAEVIELTPIYSLLESDADREKKIPSFSVHFMK